MVYTVFYKTSSFAGYCFLGKNSIHPKRYGVFSFKAYKVILVKIQICSFIDINQFPIQGVKFQLLHVLSGTDLSLEWDKLHILSEEEYIDCLLSCLAALSPSTIVHRITGDAPRSLLLAPHWSLHIKQVFNHIRQALKTQDIWQGKCFTRPT